MIFKDHMLGFFLCVKRRASTFREWDLLLFAVGDGY